jgi:hypothetical protein
MGAMQLSLVQISSCCSWSVRFEVPTYFQVKADLKAGNYEYETSCVSAADIAVETPQWRWPNTQCRSWLTAVGTAYLNLPLDEAEAMGARFEGFGPALYMNTEYDWFKFLGEGWRAASLYGLLMSLRNDPGAVPDTVRIGL